MKWGVAAALSLGLFLIPGARSDNWRWQNPIPAGNTLRAAASGQDGIIVAGGYGTVVRLDRKTRRWQHVVSPAQSHLRAVAFVSGATWVAVGFEGTIMRRLLGIAGISVLILVLTCAGIVYSWTFTPHGRLDVEVAVILKLMPRLPPPGSVPAARLRQRLRDAVRRFQGRPVPILHVEDRSIPRPLGSIPVRVYRPSDEAKLPIVVYYHGGGFTWGDLDTNDRLCRKLSNRSGAIVVSVAYRLAPEHVFPAAVEDAYAALEWAAQKGGEISGDPSRIAVAGDSTGGNLAAVMALKSRDLNGPEIALQVLYYPGMNMADLRTKSMEDFAEGYFLTRAQAQFNYNQYVPAAADRSLPYASPLLAPDHRGLPPALIITAGFDPLRDSGEKYARELADAGVPTHLSRYEGVIHGFLSLPFVRKADGAIDESAAALREAFGRNSP